MVYSTSMLPFLLNVLLSVHTHGNAIVTRRLATGDTQCANTMCISAGVHGSSVEYVLSSTGKAALGWMAIGFGQQMAGTPMIIMWPNSDGNVTLSQRTASGEAQPTLDSNPRAIATFSNALPSTSGSTPSFKFTIPTSGETQQAVIYAFSSTPPSSSSINATLAIHIDKGRFQLNLANGINTTSTRSASRSTPSKGSSHRPFPSGGHPLLAYQRLVIAHVVFCVMGFLLFLPAGALLARYLRTFSPNWFTGHWVIQVTMAGPAIVIGFALGYWSVTKAGGSHFNDRHKQLGLALFALYVAQCALGATMHFVKPKNETRRPILNYPHAIFGLFMIALAMYQIYLGFTKEWPQRTGLKPFPHALTTQYYVCIVLLPLLYFTGLSLLPWQYRQEREDRQQAATDIDDDDPDEFKLDRDGEYVN